jgi:hypothetical protein
MIRQIYPTADPRQPGLRGIVILWDEMRWFVERANVERNLILVDIIA